ncbi:GAF domain-containing protein [Hydrogenophaga palleronii]|uniref:GAF domain-containing protein n=1 Tax=Hydrogenophaga palleronii TaxID=65655 RepID=UPI0008261269|nr:GAF domain-containing protein [Hydrogenophaga palleronii]
MTQQERLEELRTALRHTGIDGGLKVLNDGIAHRYTALYRLHDSMLKNVGLFDKAGEVRAEYLAVVPLESSFCQFVLRDGFFASSDTGEDRRLDGHVYQGKLMAYHGVPVRDRHGELFGTLCHFDMLRRDISQENFELMQQAAVAFAPLLEQQP